MPAKLTKEQFIAKSIEVHGDRYDYSLVEYKNSYTKIKILCKHHGEFLQIPNKHLSKQGCPICAYEGKAKALAATAKSEFTTRANLVHNSKYSYELVDYKNCMLKVSILCPIHRGIPANS